ncbi:hypothetical protein GTGU_03266 [Trabulsiella guamensis ATCC 49490]|uniref:Uncharacterized protein n=1 Tax=Trabulsiella guamensis ATCC 49490 TaxID=1005994 RepID=A0A085A1R4_9ENTR|nr:hypothetical protein GTGU_03266 [Trabulsiella guamensis ATCC 49490]
MLLRFTGGGLTGAGGGVIAGTAGTGAIDRGVCVDEVDIDGADCDELATLFDCAAAAFCSLIYCDCVRIVGKAESDRSAACANRGMIAEEHGKQIATAVATFAQRWFLFLYAMMIISP